MVKVQTGFCLANPAEKYCATVLLFLFLLFLQNHFLRNSSALLFISIFDLLMNRSLDKTSQESVKAV